MRALAFALYVEVRYSEFAAYQRANGWPGYSRKRYAKWARWGSDATIATA